MKTPHIVVGKTAPPLSPIEYTWQSKRTECGFSNLKLIIFQSWAKTERHIEVVLYSCSGVKSDVG